MANLIAKLLQPELILLDIQATSRTSAIREVAELLRDNSEMLNFDVFYEELLNRERVEPTCLGNEVAVPHARTEEARKMLLAVGRSTAGVEFDSSNQTVKLIFVIATPRKMVTEYLTLIGSLARLLKEESLRQALLSATNKAEVIEALVEAERKL